jgi:hypothetical protein
VDIAVRCAAVGKDLGGDVHHFRRRVVTQMKRFGLAGKRLFRLRSLVKVDKTARTLATTGAGPQGRWGLEATGCAPSRLQQIRGHTAEVMANRKSGGCTTVAYALQPGGMRKDPLLAVPLSVIGMWISILPDLLASRLLLEHAWIQWWQRLEEPKGRWQKGTGHLLAVWATLWQIGLTPSQPCRWTDDEDSI